MTENSDIGCHNQTVLYYLSYSIDEGAAQMIDLATPAVFAGIMGRYISQSMYVPVKDLAYDAIERGKLREISEKLRGRFL